MNHISLSVLPIEAITYALIEQFCMEQVKEDIDLDYKSDWPSDFDRILCAFANTQGGIVLIGIEELDKTRLPKCPPGGIEGAADILRQKVLNIALDAIYPPIFPEVQICPVTGSKTHSVVFIRVNPTRLTHAVERRTRIYVRSADSNRGYSLASIADLKWLWDQRANSDNLRDALLEAARIHTLSQAITFENEELTKLWSNAPLLSISLLPTFPGQAQPIDLNHLLKVAQSLETLHSKFSFVDLHLPWDLTKWRTVPGGITLSHRGHNAYQQQFMEIGQYGHLHFAFPHPTRPVSTLPVPKHTQERCIFAYTIVAQIDLALQFAAKFYSHIHYRGPIQITCSLDRVEMMLLEYTLPGLNPLNVRYLSEPCPDSRFNLLDSEISAVELVNGLSRLVSDATQRLFWAFAAPAELEAVQSWLKGLGY